MQIFLKFSELKYLERFQKEGQLYCNSIQFFAKYPQESGIGDLYENVVEQHYHESGQMTMKLLDGSEKVIDFEAKDVAFKMMDTNHFVNIFCLYCIDSEKHIIGEKIKISDDMKKAGNYCMIIYNFGEFINRIQNELNKKNIQYKFDFIEYIDFSKYTGKKTVFQKPVQLSYQNEYRIAFKNDCPNAYEVFIGNIEDISIIYPTESIPEIIFGYQENN